MRPRRPGPRSFAVSSLVLSSHWGSFSYIALKLATVVFKPLQARICFVLKAAKIFPSLPPTNGFRSRLLSRRVEVRRVCAQTCQSLGASKRGDLKSLGRVSEPFSVPIDKLDADVQAIFLFIVFGFFHNEKPLMSIFRCDNHHTRFKEGPKQLICDDTVMKVILKLGHHVTQLVV